MFFIALYINERVDHVLLFKPRQTSTSVEKFIVERNNYANTQLLAFYHHAERGSKESKQHSDIVIQTAEKQMRARFVSIKSEWTSNEECCINVVLHVTNQESNEDIDAKDLDDDFTFEWGKSYLWPLCLKGERWKDIKFVRIRFTLMHSEPQTTAEILLVVSSKDQISDTVLDFGSEASQMARSYRDKENLSAVDIQDTFHAMKRLWNGIDKQGTESKSSDYEQYESKQLFRTVFYANREVPTESPKAYEGGMKSNILHMLTTKNEGQDLLGSEQWFVLPTIKISQFGNIPLPSVECKEDRRRITVNRYGNNYFYRACINQFIYVALKECERPCVNLHVLMPNVYSVKTTAENLRYIKEDIDLMLKDKEMGLEHIRAVEVSAISESDASFVGAYDNFQSAIDSKSLSSGNYLIIDSGKGTTDFSVVNLSRKDKKIQNLFRSGVIGAGGVISYGFLLAMLHDCLSHSIKKPNKVSRADLQNFVCKILQNKDLSYQKQLMSVVEDYKIALSSGSYIQHEEWKSNEQIDSIEKIEISKMVELFKEMVNKESQKLIKLTIDAQQYVDGCIDHLTNEILRRLRRVNRLGIAPCVKVMLAGRAFMNPQFKKELLKKLSDAKIIPPKGEIELTYNGPGINHKNVCLFCSLHMTGDKAMYNSHMLSVPQMAFDDHGEIEKSWREKHLADRAYKWKYSESNYKQKAAKILLFIDKGVKWVSSLWVERISFDYYEPGNNKRNGIVKGFKIKIKSNTDQISFGNTIYNIPNRFSPGDYHLFFTGDELFLRNKNGVVGELNSHSIDDQRTDLAFATMFPNICVNDPAAVWLPDHVITNAKGQDKEEKTKKEEPLSPESSPLDELRKHQNS